VGADHENGDEPDPGDLDPDLLGGEGGCQGGGGRPCDGPGIGDLELDLLMRSGGELGGGAGSGH
jgi:hypothetical protein